MRQDLGELFKQTATFWFIFQYPIILLLHLTLLIEHFNNQKLISSTKLHLNPYDRFYGHFLQPKKACHFVVEMLLLFHLSNLKLCFCHLALFQHNYLQQIQNHQVEPVQFLVTAFKLRLTTIKFHLSCSKQIQMHNLLGILCH